MDIKLDNLIAANLEKAKTQINVNLHISTIFIFIGLFY